MTTNGRTTPTRKTASKQKVHFDIAAAIEELDVDEIEPYTTEWPKGNVVEFADPRKIGYIHAAGLDLNNPVLLFSDLIEDREQYREFVSVDIPNEVAKKLILAWRDHYKVLDLGN